MLPIFNIKTEAEFLSQCIETFQYQYHHVDVYQKFVDYLKVDYKKITQIHQIPFLPIELYKNHIILDKNFTPKEYFQSSGTTNLTNPSKHYIADFNVYKQSIAQSFKKFIGKPEDFVILGLLPNYSQNPHSSLIYMVDDLMKQSGKPENGYFLNNHLELLTLLKGLKNKKTILFGVSFALLDFIEFKNKTSDLQCQHLMVIETGGMKGRKEEITKDELLEKLKKGFGTQDVFSEYSMTELLSQAYSLGENLYATPNWMRILIRSTEDPFDYLEDGKTGAINIIDLANKHSCSFIATQDLGKTESILTTENQLSKTFQVLGRIDHSDVRGCSLLVV